jgi:hypothetical protein
MPDSFDLTTTTRLKNLGDIHENANSPTGIIHHCRELANIYLRTGADHITFQCGEVLIEVKRREL